MRLAYNFEKKFKRKKDVLSSYHNNIKEKLTPLTKEILNVYGIQNKMEKIIFFKKICSYIALNSGLDDPTNAEV